MTYQKKNHTISIFALPKSFIAVDNERHFYLRGKTEASNLYKANHFLQLDNVFFFFFKSTYPHPRMSYPFLINQLPDRFLKNTNSYCRLIKISQTFHFVNNLQQVNAKEISLHVLCTFVYMCDGDSVFM